MITTLGPEPEDAVDTTSMRLRYLFLLVGALAGLAPATVSASVTGLAVAPAHSDPQNPSSRSYFLPTISPGGSFADEVKVSNSSDAPLKLYVSTVDGLTGATTGAVYANRQDPVRKWGAWLSIAQQSLSLAPHSTTDVPFTVQVPQDAAPGDHLAGIAFEDADPAASGGNFRITTVVRAVIGVLVKVPGPAAAHVHLYGASLMSLPGVGTAGIAIDMADDGGLLTKPRLVITVDGPRAYHRSVERQLDTLLPGDRITDPIPWPVSLPAGDYQVAIAAIIPGASDSLLRTAAHLDGALEGTRPTEPTAGIGAKASTGYPVPLWLLVAGPEMLAILLALPTLALVRHRRRRPCMHCRTMLRNQRLIEVTDLNTMYGCRNCARAVHNTGRVVLCLGCYKEHVTRQLVR